MKRILRKLKNRRGESLIESLVAILIFSLASVVMYSMVTTASDINIKARTADETHQAQLIVAEQGEGTGRRTTVSLTLVETPAGAEAQSVGSVDVEVYGGENDSLYAYYVVPKGDG